MTGEIQKLLDTMHMEAPVTKIMKQSKLRLDSGPLQIGDDWPGYFFRGKHAFFYGSVLAGLIEQVYPDGSPTHESMKDLTSPEIVSKLITYNSLCNLRDELLSVDTREISRELDV